MKGRERERETRVTEELGREIDKMTSMCHVSNVKARNPSMRPPSHFLPFQIHIPQLSVQTATEQKILMANMLYVEQVFLGIPVCKCIMLVPS